MSQIISNFLLCLILKYQSPFCRISLILFGHFVVFFDIFTMIMNFTVQYEDSKITLQDFTNNLSLEKSCWQYTDSCDFSFFIIFGQNRKIMTKLLMTYVHTAYSNHPAYLQSYKCQFYAPWMTGNQGFIGPEKNFSQIGQMGSTICLLYCNVDVMCYVQHMKIYIICKGYIQLQLMCL